MEGVALLPDHSSQIDAAFLWVDLAGHLANAWRYLIAAAQVAHGRPISIQDWKLPDVDGSLEAWRSSDRLYDAFQILGDTQQRAR